MNPNATIQCFGDDHIIYREGLPATEWVSFGMTLALMVGICLGNGLIIATFIRIWKLLTLSNYLILQLVLADFAFGCSLLYNSFAKVFRKLMLSHNLCALRLALYLFPGTASIIGIVVITCNRYFAIVLHPLTYQDNPSPRYYVIHTLTIWIPSAILGFLVPMMWHNHCPQGCTFSLIMTTSYLKYLFEPFFLIVAILLMALYAHIIVTAKKHLRNITDGTGQPQEPPGQPQENVYKKGDIKILKACLLIFTTFYIFWLPFLVILGIQLNSGQLEQASLMSKARILSMHLMALNSLANPLIYGYRLPIIKSELSMMFSNWRTRLPCHIK